MRYVVVSSSEIRSKAIFNLVREYLPEVEGTYLVGKYDMDFLLDENLDFLFFDRDYYIEYKNKIMKKKIFVKNLVLIYFEGELEENVISPIKVIDGSNTLEELRNFLQISDLEEKFFNLSERDKSMLFLLSQGLKNKDIGKKLYLSEKTIKNNLTRIYRILEVNNKYEAINVSSKLFNNEK